MQVIYGEVRSKGSVYAYANRFKQTIDLIQRVAKPGATILDVAAAQGNFSLRLAEMGYEVTWNDIREELIGYVNLKYERGAVHFAPGDVFSLNFRDRFDLVLATEIIEHVAHPDDFLEKISGLVKKGGYVILTTPNGEYFRYRAPRFSKCRDFSKFEKMQFGPSSDKHLFLLHLKEIDMLAQRTDLTILKTKIFTNFLTNGHIKSEGLLKLMPSKWVNSFEQLTGSLPLACKKRICNHIAVLFNKPA